MNYVEKLKYFNNKIIKLYNESNQYTKSLHEYIHNNNLSIDELISIKNNIPIFSNEHKNLIISIDKIIFKNCSHKWHLDTSNFGERSQFICTVCKLYS